jgi:hypothetical protein
VARLVSEAHVFRPRFGDGWAKGSSKVKEDVIFNPFWWVPFGILGVVFRYLVHEVPVVDTDISIKNWWKYKVIPPVS